MAKSQSFIDLCEQTGEAGYRLLREAAAIIRFFFRLCGMVKDSILHPGKVRLQQVAYHLDHCGSDAVPIISMLGLLIGVILAFQAITQLGRYGVQNYVVSLVGTVIVNELAPLVTAVVLAGRSGSAFAAELGTMKTNEELDAMVTMGFDTGRFLILPKVLALLMALPGLTIIADICGIIGGMLVVCGQLNITVPEYVNSALQVIKPIDLTQGLFKSFVFGFIVAAIGCHKGISSGRDAQGVGRSATSAVVTSIFLIVLADALLTAVFAGIENLW
ncbi:MAG: ABC transporter permease [Lentisphaeria bacterium]|nr:ABC transporter permease [Lentisphaeria bacterium]MBQ7393888.1 ABC transporter permease [Lentisphaeria bacterium]MBR2643345.1 ABC transporter permease [Lentisphaeria bacterium]